MFGKTHELHDDTTDGRSVDGFFGDESAAAEAAEIDALRERVVQVESQINSQFTSLATYAQIAQEQVELARAEARAATERSEKRVIELVERERADRISSTELGSASAPDGSLATRLEELEHSVARMKATLDECFAQQMALAGAINRLLEPRAAAAPEPKPAADRTDSSELPGPLTTTNAPLAPPAPVAPSFPAPTGPGPISGLSLRLA